VKSSNAYKYRPNNMDCVVLEILLLHGKHISEWCVRVLVVQEFGLIHFTSVSGR